MECHQLEQKQDDDDEQRKELLKITTHGEIKGPIYTDAFSYTVDRIC